MKYLDIPVDSKFCLVLDKLAQSSAHAFRTDVLAFHSAQAGLGLLADLKNVLPKDPPAPVVKLLSGIENALRVSGTSALHNADCVARMNALALKNVRSTWLFNSSLGSDLKARLNKSPICNGVMPLEPQTEFVAPIVGSLLQEELDQEYDLSKKSIS